MSKIQNVISCDKIKTFIAVAGAVVMYFTPPPYDAVITALLSAFGIGDLVIKDKQKT